MVGCLSASSQSLRLILSLRMNSSFMTLRPGLKPCVDQGGGGVPDFFFFFLIHRCSAQRAVGTSLEKAIGSKWSNCLLRGSLLEFLRKPIATCDFPWGIPTPCSPIGSNYGNPKGKFSPVMAQNMNIYHMKSRLGVK